MKAVELKNISVSYGNVQALQEVNLSVNEGQFLGVIGPNGAGKSTLLKVILGLIKPQTGLVKIYGEDVKERQNKIAYVPQASSFDLNFPINVLDVVLMGRLTRSKAFLHKFRSSDREIVEFYLQKLGLDKLKNRQIGQLSGGQLQKVLIARALVLEPKIILLDEPTASIDATTRNDIYDLLQELNNSMTIIVVTHELAAVSAYFDSIACLNKTLHYHGGKELSEETIKKVYGCPVDLIAHGIPHRVLKEHREG